jgi:hypothetical protein
MGQHGRVGVRMSQLGTQVDHPTPAGALGDQAGVVAGVGHRGHGLDQGVQERAAADIGQLPAIVQLPEHGDGVGGLAAVGEAQHGSPDGPVGGPVEVGACVKQRAQFPARSVLDGFPAQVTGTLDAAPQRPSWALTREALETLVRL